MSDPFRKKVLILTYYWPPSGGAGVQRWLKFTKYLREFNYEPVIYTAADPEYPSLDESLFRDIPENLTVLRTRVWEPYKLYKWFTFQKRGYRINTGFLNKDKQKGPAERISVWIRGNWFIPDARKFWIKPSIRYLTRYLKDHPVSLMVSTGPPHSLHLIALGVSEKLHIPWVADFRDPWTKIDFYQDLMLGRRADRMHQRLERKVLQTANAVTVISQDMKRQFEEMGGSNLRVIPNGFDPDDFILPGESPEGGTATSDDDWIRPDSEFSLTHIGSIVPSRNPQTLWTVLSGITGENKDFANRLKIFLVGAVDYSVIRSVDEAGLTPYVSFVDYLPHRDAIIRLRNSQVLLLLINNTPNAKGILTGKFFEYMNSGRPILAIGPPAGEAAKVLEETGTGHMVDFNDSRKLKQLILDYFNQYREGKLYLPARNLEKYSRRTLTANMTELFNEILNTA
jgi:hypothetical protein